MISQLKRTLELIRESDKNKLRNIIFIKDLVLNTGLRWSPIEYPSKYHEFMLPRKKQIEGIWQEPQQFSEALVFLSNESFIIEKIISIGTFNGWTDFFMLLYLSRFHSLKSFISLDPYIYVEGKPDIYSFDGRIWELLENEKISCYSQHKITSENINLVTTPFCDLCIIDGMHSIEWVTKDWKNIGQYARVSWFHDINNELVGDENVPNFWKNTISKKYRVVEFTHDEEDKKRFGIGIKY